MQRRSGCSRGRGGTGVSETLSALISGFGVALAPLNLLWGFIGVTLGTAIGVLPGVGPALSIAMLLPQTDQVWINYVNSWIELKKTQGFFEETALKWGL